MADEQLWLIKGPHDAPGWRELEKGAKDGTLNWRLFDRDGFVLVLAAEPPSGYDGFTVAPPADGLYLDQQGRPVYVVGAREVRDGYRVIDALGPDAQRLLDELEDPDAALQRLGRVF